MNSMTAGKRQSNALWAGQNNLNKLGDVKNELFGGVTETPL